MWLYINVTTIRNKILNHNKAAQSVIVDDQISFSSSAGTCDYEKLSFFDEHNGHIMTRNLRMITNFKSKSPLNKKPNYRDPNCISYGK